MSSTSLVFNIVARDRASATLGKMKEKFSTAAAGIGAGVAGALGVGVAASLDMGAASDKMAAQLGVGPAEAASLSKVSASVYKNAWGESTTDVNNAIKGVYQNIGDVGAAQGGLEGVTTKVMALSDTFEQDLGGTTAAVGQMMKTGLAKNADEALDILTRGFQTGANKADDLLDTMNEYGGQFQKFGLSGQMATGLLSQGLKGGARDADLVADSIKEFSIRAIDGSKGTAEGFAAIGLNAGDMAKKIGAGGASATGALDLTLDKLRAIKDPVDRDRAAVALFGTQAEDMGKALYSLDPSTAVQALGQVGGAADKMAKTVGDNPKAALETFKRSAMEKLTAVTGSFVEFAMKNQQVVGPLAIALGGIAATILIVKGAMMVWTAVQAVWTGVTAAATAAQWLFNVAMSANPIGLIIIAVIALVAGIILLWKKSETFRNIVTGAFNAVWGAIKAVWGWVKKNWPLLLAILVGPFGLAVLAIVKNWDKVKAGGVKVWNWIKGLPGKIGSALSKVGGIVSAPFKAGFNLVAKFWNNTVGKLRFAVPGWVPGLGGKGFSFPQIPYLAKGGNITGAGIAMVGERGPEVLHLPAGASVSPLSRGSGGGVGIDENRLARAVAREVAAAMRDVTVVSYLDGQKVTDNVSRHQGRTADQRRRTG